MRTCTDCGITKSITEFTPIKGTRDTHTRCKSCRAARASTGYEHSSSALAQTRRTRREQWAEGVLTCTACGATKPLTGFVRIKQSRDACYGRCRACRAVRARQRYQTVPQERAAQIQRTRRNRQNRKQRLIVLTSD